MASEREQRGLVIAETCKLTKKGHAWIVPSQSSGKTFYTVVPDSEQPHCTCPDHETRGCKCKHIYAVEILIQRELFDDGSIKETRMMSVTTHAERPTYRQNWPAYNAAQRNEKEQFQILLRDLCSRIPEPPRAETGRKPFPIQDAIFAACFKVYSTVSGRRFASDLRDAHDEGYIGRVPSVPMVWKIFETPHIFYILQSLVVEAATPLKALETHFACDSSGFSASRFDKWFDHKHGENKIRRSWVKAHVMTGCKTNVVTAIEIHDQHAGDSPQLKPLLDTTTRNFKPLDVCADMAYLSHSNLYAIARAGASPLIPFKSNSSSSGSRLWEHLFHYVQLHRDEFLSRYHQRSNVESTFSMVKAKFGDSVRSKTDVAMKNEVLAKFICHNICCVIQSMYEFGIDPAFWTAA